MQSGRASFWAEALERGRPLFCWRVRTGKTGQALGSDEEYKERARDVSSKMEPGDSSRRNSISRMSHDAFLLIFCEPRVSAIELNINVAQ